MQKSHLIYTKSLTRASKSLLILAKLGAHSLVLPMFFAIY